ncbi:MAG: hypothetical protein QXQ94_06665 [Candidatus Bathyarchaeia archaeon]
MKNSVQPKSVKVKLLQFSKILMVMLLFSATLFVSPAACPSQSEAESQIQLAEEEVLNCYRAIYEAEKAGANVSDLLNSLNEAGWLLSQAKHAYNRGDYDLAFSLANQSLTELEGFIEKANSLRMSAEQARFFDFMVNFVGSAVGALAIVVCGYGVWLSLKKREKAVKV